MSLITDEQHDLSIPRNERHSREEHPLLILEAASLLCAFQHVKIIDQCVEIRFDFIVNVHHKRLLVILKIQSDDYILVFVQFEDADEQIAKIIRIVHLQFENDSVRLDEGGRNVFKLQILCF